MINKNNYRRIFACALSLMCALGMLTACSGKNGETTQPEVVKIPAYLASEGLTADVYTLKTSDEGGKYFELYDSLVRGTDVLSLDETVSAEMSKRTLETAFFGAESELSDLIETASADASDDSQESDLVSLAKIQLPDELTDSEGNDVFYYVYSDSLAFSKEDIVRETSKWVRTSVTVYKNSTGPEISGFSKKGSAISVTGYDYLNEDGSVNKYNISDSSGTTGWVYSKYLVDDEASALAVNEAIYEIHKNRIYEGLELNGGDPKNLDWYAFDKPAIEGNDFCSEAKTMYLNASACVNSESYLELIKSSGVNAVVIDIKDGQLAYKSEAAKTLCPSAYETAFVTMDEYKAAVKKFKDAGVYTIGRIVCFSDSYYAQDHPETCIDSPVSYTAWPSAYSRDAWYYNVSLAVEAVENMEFNEIQFDYVRFPENAYNMSQDATTDFKNVYVEDKAEAVQNFCMYAMDSIREAGAYFSVDVFGECADEYVTAYGQYWPAISNVVDAISGMPYTDHYGSAVDTWTNPYDIVYTFAEKAAKRQTEIETCAAARTWITGYNTPNWNPTVNYDESKLDAQIRALYDAGLTGGFIPWNGGSNINKYYEYSGIWSKDYNTVQPQ